MSFFLNIAALTVTSERHTPEDLEISSKPDLAAVDTKDLIRFYNKAVPSSQVKKFASRAVGVLRVYPLLERMAVPEDVSPWNLGASPDLPRPAPVVADPPETQEDDVAKATAGKKKSTKKAATNAANGKKVGRAPSLAGSKLVRVGDTNPCRDGGIRAKSWDLIGGGLKYETYIEKGGNVAALAFNIKTGRVKVQKAT